MERTIKVTGKGKFSAVPDLTKLNLEFSEKFKTYDKALLGAKQSLSKLKEALKLYEDKIISIRTRDYRITEVYESERTSNGVYANVLKGYSYTQTIIVTFPIDNILLGKIIKSFIKANITPTIDICYAIKDEEEVKNALLSKAVQDGLTKAKILAKAANVTLGNLKSIDYSWQEITFETQEYSIGCARVEEDFSLDIDPEDINKVEEVTLIWEII